MNTDAIEEAKATLNKVYPHYNDKDRAVAIDTLPSHYSEIMSGKKGFSLRVIRVLVSIGADAGLMIRSR